MNKTNFDSKDSRNITKDTLIVRLLSVVCLIVLLLTEN
ncbi:type IV secretion system protein VirD4 [Nitrosomonas ureae]|uniref:Type IV secretion system protein VirD4 n=1 Tax=Nitrosomonas ureae TaxID=44577 RepID=A0A1H5VWK2_9PROT|nr:type IV secretion system protein VirD4 [Nitrosomonas ureae]